MDAGKDLARLVDPLRPSPPHRIERASPRPIDAGQAKDMDGNAVAAMKLEPLRLGRDPAPAAFAAWAKGRPLIDQGTAAIAIDAGRREKPQPGERGQGTDLRPMLVEDAIAHLIGRHRNEEMRNPRENGGKIFEPPAPGEGQKRRRSFAAGAGDAPPFGAERAGKVPGAITQPEDKEARGPHEGTSRSSASSIKPWRERAQTQKRRQRPAPSATGSWRPQKEESHPIAIALKAGPARNNMP